MLNLWGGVCVVLWPKKIPRQNWSVSLEVRAEMFVFMGSFKRFVGSRLAWSDDDVLVLQWHSMAFNLIHIS